MKKIAFSLAFFSILLISCNDNSSTDPISPNPVNKNSETVVSSFKGSIPIDKLLIFPGTTEKYYHIKGKIDYNGEFTGIIPNQITNIDDIKLEIFINALLAEDDISTNIPDPNYWRVSSESQDRFYVGPEGKKVFEKVYYARRGNDKMQLVCTFIATTNSLSLDDVTLKSLVGWYGINNSQ